MISGFCHGVNEINTVVRFYTTHNCSLLVTAGQGSTDRLS